MSAATSEDVPPLSLDLRFVHWLKLQKFFVQSLIRTITQWQLIVANSISTTHCEFLRI